MRLSRLRVGFQILLHVVLIGHVLAYYWLDWRGVGALDFQSFFRHFLGEGVLTAGALLAIGVYGSALVFGRLFCSWGCHFGATQDFAAWVLRRLGWRPRLVRTRFLHWLPFFFLCEIFIAPLIRRWAREDWSLAVDIAAVAPWDTLPGWFLSVVTFVVCGAAILIFLGTRGFCRFVCPYGAVFRVTDRIAPFRVRRLTSCSGAVCGSDSAPASATPAAPPCTVACPTAIDVHRETSLAGVVTSTDCVRCNLCIEACPQGALGYRARSVPIARPQSPQDEKHASPPAGAAAVTARPSSGGWTLTRSAETLVAVVTIATYFIVDLVYGGHFLAAVMALGEGFLIFGAFTVLRDRGRRWTFAGVTLLGIALLSVVPLFEASAFKWLRSRALRIDPARAESDLELAKALDGAPPPDRLRLLEAAGYYQRALEYFPRHTETLRLLLSAYLRLHDRRAMEVAEELCRQSDNSPQNLELLYWVYLRYGEFERARRLGGAASG